jgi:hypothetical protein
MSGINPFRDCLSVEKNDPVHPLPPPAGDIVPHRFTINDWANEKSRRDFPTVEKCIPEQNLHIRKA